MTTAPHMCSSWCEKLLSKLFCFVLCHLLLNLGISRDYIYRGVCESLLCSFQSPALFSDFLDDQKTELSILTFLLWPFVLRLTLQKKGEISCFWQLP